MLSGMQIAVIGGDARQLEVIQTLLDLDATVILIGYDELPNRYKKAIHTNLDEQVLKHADAVVLPASGGDDSGKIDCAFSRQEIRLTEELIGNLPKHARIYAGTANDFLTTACAQYQIEIMELSKRDDVLIYNSILTAEGAILSAIQKTDFTIHGSKCLVLGFERAGIPLSRALQTLGAHVAVGEQSGERIARATAMGFDAFDIKELSRQAMDTDIVFNNIPATVLTAQVIKHLPHWALIVDLADNPGGTDFRFARKRGIQAFLAQDLPGTVAPRTAGQIAANAICKLMLENVPASPVQVPIP